MFALVQKNCFHLFVLQCYTLLGVALALVYRLALPIWGVDSTLLLGSGLCLCVPIVGYYLHSCLLARPQNPIEPLRLAIPSLLLWLAANSLLCATQLYSQLAFFSLPLAFLGFIALLVVQNHTSQVVGKSYFLQQSFSTVFGLSVGLCIGLFCYAQQNLCMAWSGLSALLLSSSVALYSRNAKTITAAPYTYDFLPSFSWIGRILSQQPAKLCLSTILWFWLNCGALAALSFQDALWLWPYWLLGFVLGSFACLESRQLPLQNHAASFLYAFFTAGLVCIALFWYSPNTHILLAWLHWQTWLVFLFGVFSAWLLLPAARELGEITWQDIDCVGSAGLSFMAMLTLWLGVWSSFALPAQTLLLLLALFSGLLGWIHHGQMSIIPIVQLLNSTLKLSYKLLFSLEIQGELPRPSDQPTLIIANHTSLLDVAVIATLFPEKLVYPIFPNWLRNWLIRDIGGCLADLYPMTPTNPHSMMQVIKSIQSGRRGLIFPEGRLTNTGNLMKLYDGAAIIADRAQALIQPIIIQGGMNHVSSRQDYRSRRTLFPKLSVRIGNANPIDPGELQGKAKRRFIIRRMFQAIQETTLQIFPEYDVAAALRHAHHIYNTRRLVVRGGFGKRIAISDADWQNTFSYYCLIGQAERIAYALHQYCNKTTLIGVWMSSNCDMAQSMLGVLFAQHIVMPIEQDIQPDTFSKLLDQHCPSIIICSQAMLESERYAPGRELLRQHNITLLSSSSLLNGCSRLTAWLWRKPNPKSSAKTPGVLFPQPDGEAVLLSQHNICQQAYQLQLYANLFGNDICYNQAGLHHPYGFHVGFMLPLLSGVPVMFQTDTQKSPSATIESIYDTRSTVLVCAADFLASASKSLECAHDTRNLRLVLHNGPDIARDLVMHWIQQCKLEIHAIWCPDDAAAVISMQHGYYQQDNGLGQLLIGMRHAACPAENGGPVATACDISSLTGPQLSSMRYDPTQAQLYTSCDPKYQLQSVIAQDYMGFLQWQDGATNE